MATFDNIKLSEPAASTTSKVVGAVAIARGSTTEYQSILCIGDPTSSNAVAAVSTAAPATGDAALAVRQVGYVAPSTTVSVANQSTTVNVSSLGGVVTQQPNSTGWGIAAGFHFDSSGALQITGASGSTTVNVSSLGGVVSVSPNSTGWGTAAGFHFDSSGALQITGASGSTTVNVSSLGGVVKLAGNSSAADYLPVRIVDSSGTGYLAPGLEYTDGSTTSTLAAPGLAYSNGSNTTMRLVGTTQPLPVQLRTGINTYNSTFVTLNSSASSAFYQLISSAASVKACVYALSITSTASTPFLFEFLSSTDAAKWGLDLGSGSSGVTGANLAVTPPARLFETAAAANLNARLGSTGHNVRVSLSWFTE